MKNSTKTIAIVGTTVALLSIGAVGYAATNGHGPWNGMGGGMRNGSGMQHNAMNGSGMGGMQGGGMNGRGWTVPVAPSGASLDPTERDALLHMVEEEKLAHDVYVTLGAANDAPMFDHIAQSETQHEAAVRALLTRYGVSDPTAGNGVGEFTDPTFDALYTKLVAEGSGSIEAAAQVGQKVEQLDIDDLTARLAQTTQTDIVAVFQHLLTGSQHHLRAFTNLGTNGTNGTNAADMPCDPADVAGMGHGRMNGQGSGRQAGN